MWAGKRRWTEKKSYSLLENKMFKVLRSRYAIKLLQNVQCLIVAKRHATGEKIICSYTDQCTQPIYIFLDMKKEAFSLVGLAVVT